MIYAIKGFRDKDSNNDKIDRFWLLTSYSDAHSNFGYISVDENDKYKLYFWSDEENEENFILRGKNYKEFHSFYEVFSFILTEAKISDKICEAEWSNKKCYVKQIFGINHQRLPSSSDFDNGTYYIVKISPPLINIRGVDDRIVYLVSKDAKTSFGRIIELSDKRFEVCFYSEKEPHLIQSPWAYDGNKIIELILIKKGLNVLIVNRFEEACDVFCYLLPDHLTEIHIEGHITKFDSLNKHRFDNIISWEIDRDNRPSYEEGNKSYDNDWKEEAWDALTDGQYGDYEGQDISEWMEKHGF